MRSPDLYLGDCLFWLAMLPDNSVDAVVTDPPYGLRFMGKKWDYDVPSEAIWRECLRVLKPGGHLMAFAGTRTQHRMAVRIEDAGFEIRDMIAWVYGSGFPKSLDVSKAIDKAAGAEREKVRVKPRADTSGTMVGASDTRPWIEKSREVGYHEVAGDVPVTEAARQWQGWGTALKPALEPITVARKPLVGTVAENVLTHRTGALNIDGCRVPTDDKLGGGNNSATVDRSQKHEGWQRPWMQDAEAATRAAERSRESTARSEALGRWPANLIHDGSDEVVAGFPDSNGQQGKTGKRKQGVLYNAVDEGEPGVEPRGDTGSAARFFYCAKASKRDRDEGCEGFEVKKSSVGDNRPGGDFNERLGKTPGVRANVHPTVKPTDLMRYLCRLVTPPGGTVLDPFMGSGSTGKAAALEGFHFIGMERDADYFTIAQARIDHARKAD